VTLLLPFGPLHGVNIALVKQAARFMMDMDSAELYDFAVSLGIGLTTAEPIWRAFISDGYIGESEGRFVPTQRMAQLPMARFGKPLPRKKAAVLRTPRLSMLNRRTHNSTMSQAWRYLAPIWTRVKASWETWTLRGLLKSAPVYRTLFTTASCITGIAWRRPEAGFAPEARLSGLRTWATF
jgi:hypothetical protein